MAVFYDTHAHITWPDFADDLAGVVSRAKDNGIERIITIGTDLESSERAIEIAAEFDEVFAVVGWHPGDVDAAPDDVRKELKELAGRDKVVAIGETGLDYYRLPSTRGGTEADDETYKARQAVLFDQQLQIAEEARLNVVIHTRGDCFADTLGHLEPYHGKLRAVFHCFVETPDNMRKVLALDGLVSFTGIATFKNAAEVRDTVSETPLDKLMVETDSPFLAPMPFRGKKCQPAYTKYTAEKVAEVKGCSLEELSRVSCETAKGFFKGFG
ncbi:MAG: DNAase [Verrucomicrobiales bacterium]|nr:DNAase [Verrucomicrobiales bacterium]|tara:strand:- start:6735 stop:7544 length:810 start_codon:yes stop_codon:yes gene_type:complete